MDPDLYDRLGDTWWDENHFLNFLEMAVNPPRFAYIDRHLPPSPAGSSGLAMLDVGSGGGLLAELFARSGHVVTGIDPAARSVETARAHAEQSGLTIDYQVGSGEHMPFDVARFDVVYCCDVLEHVDDLDDVLREVSRVLRPGGLFFFDTINRTRRSKLLAIKMFQEWSWTRWADPGLHDWEKFIKPDEMLAALNRASLARQHHVGLAPRSLVKTVKAMRLRARGRLTVGQMGARFELVEGRDDSVLYMGHARKTA